MNRIADSPYRMIPDVLTIDKTPRGYSGSDFGRGPGVYGNNP